MPEGLDSATIRHVQQVFAAVVDEPPAQREADLARLCCGVPGVEARVRALLARADRDAPLAGPKTSLARSEPAPRPEVTAADRPLRVGGVVGGYEVVEALGRHSYRVVGGPRPGHPAVLRLLRCTAEADADAVRAHFAQTVARLHEVASPDIARPLEVLGLEAPWLGLVREFVPGGPLLEHCQDLRTCFDQVIQHYRQVCWAVHRAHRRGVVHGALRPDRILLRTDREPPTAVVLDFGLLESRIGADLGHPPAEPGHDLRALGALLPELCGARLRRSLGMARAYGNDRRAPAAAAESFLRLLQAAATGTEADASPTRRLAIGMQELAAGIRSGGSPAHRAFADALDEDRRLLLDGVVTDGAPPRGPSND